MPRRHRGGASCSPGPRPQRLQAAYFSCGRPRPRGNWRRRSPRRGTPLSSAHPLSASRSPRSSPGGRSGSHYSTVRTRSLPGGAHGLLAAAIQALFERHGVEVRLSGAPWKVWRERQRGGLPFQGRQNRGGRSRGSLYRGEAHIGFLDPMQVRTAEAVLVDERLETSVQGLYAAVSSQGINIISGKHEWLATWENACCRAGSQEEHGWGKRLLPRFFAAGRSGLFFEWTYAHLATSRGTSGRRKGGRPDPKAFRSSPLFRLSLGRTIPRAGLKR